MDVIGKSGRNVGRVVGASVCTGKERIVGASVVGTIGMIGTVGASVAGIIGIVGAGVAGMLGFVGGSVSGNVGAGVTIGIDGIVGAGDTIGIDGNVGEIVGVIPTATGAGVPALDVHPQVV